MGGGSANAIFTLPVTAATIPGIDGRQALGDAMLIDDNGNSHRGVCLFASTTTGIAYAQNVSGANIILAAITSTVPFTWTNPDEISITGSYQAA